MKKNLLLTVSAALLYCTVSFAQHALPPAQYQQQKDAGQLNGKAPATILTNDDSPMEVRIAPGVPVHPASNSCTCWQQRDNTFSIVPFTIGTPPLYRNDDGSTSVISIPFTFCLYGTNWTQLYINNNGNVSFGAPYSTFTATGFPNAAFVMVAPFWGDVDTRNAASGLVYYKITPTYMIVQWDSVGYYGNHADKRNTFQLIITDGSDPIVPGGNVSFCYKDMQWTTGDASSGSGGFGGSDAIVGANRGDGVNYIQFGSFNQPGSTYNGPTGLHSGIDWLDNQTFIFDACTNSNNIPPTVSGITFCDTLRICEGDSLPLNVTFFSPEVGQTTTITVDTTGVTGYHQVSNTSGNTATLNSYFTGNSSNAGYNQITITATDDGVPPASTVIPIIIQVTPAPVTTVSPDTSVCNGPVQLLATGGGTYSWSPSSGLSCNNCANPTATPTVTTTYVVTVTTGCSVNDTVTVFAPPQVTITPNTIICIGDSVPLNATGGTSYTWSPSTGLSNPNIANPMATPTVTTTYTVTVAYAAFPSCVRTDSVMITVNQPPTITITPDTSTCYGAVQLQATGGGTYSWSPTAGLSNPNIANPVASPATTTTYVVTVNNGCSATASVVVAVPPPISATPPNSSICSGNSVSLNATGGTSYVWSPGTGLSNPNIANPVATPTVTTTYTVAITNSNFGACTRIDSVQIVVTPTPVAFAGNDTSICRTTAAQLNASGGTTYSWSPTTNLSNPNIANPVATPTTTTTYVVTVSNGVCTDMDTVVVQVQSVSPTAGPNATICIGNNIQLNASGGTNYSWSPSAGLSATNIANPVASPTVTTTYTVTVSNALGCSATQTVTVTVAPLPSPSFTFVPSVIFVDSSYAFLDLSTGGVVSWHWTFGDGDTSNQSNPTHFYSSAGTFVVCLVTTTANGCTDSTCTDVEVKPRDVLAPNVFTPNGDGTNDFLVFKDLEYYPGTSLKVYDRWGVLVYQSDNYLNDWNGKKFGSGTDCVDGTYYYVLQGPKLSKVFTGFVTLIRGK